MAPLQWKDDYVYSSLPHGTIPIILQAWHMWVFTVVSGIMSKTKLTKEFKTALLVDIERLVLPVIMLCMVHAMLGHAISVFNWWHIFPALLMWRILCEPIYTLFTQHSYGIAVLIGSFVFVPVGLHAALGTTHVEKGPLKE